ncbi:MAG: hypothetical protein AAGF71_09775 [Pseudomonadota bacterium]
MSRFEIILLCLCLGACSSKPAPVPVDPLALAGLQGTGFHIIDDPAQFLDRVVNNPLDGPGYRVDVRPGGLLDGLYAGERFTGVWSFRDSKYCHAFGPKLSGPTYSCHWVAVKGNDLRLIPVPQDA